MKHTKKLIPAIGMLLLSACMLVTSTFAWFSMNENVTATNMTVTAKGNQVYLQIINPNAKVLDEDGEPTETNVTFQDGAPQTSAAATLQTGTILPVNVVNKIGTTEAPDNKKVCTPYAGDGTLLWVTNVGTSTEDGTAKADYTQIASNTDANYYLKNTFQIRLDPTAGAQVASAPLRVEAVGAKNTDAKDTTFQKCLSVLVVCSYNGTSKGCVWEFNGTGFTCVLGEADLTTAAFAAGVTATVDIYVFFNGDNEYCTQENLAKAANGGYGVDVSFSVATKAPVQNG